MLMVMLQTELLLSSSSSLLLLLLLSLMILMMLLLPLNYCRCCYFCKKKKRNIVVIVQFRLFARSVLMVILPRVLYHPVKKKVQMTMLQFLLLCLVFVFPLRFGNNLVMFEPVIDPPMIRANLDNHLDYRRRQ